MHKGAFLLGSPVQHTFALYFHPAHYYYKYLTPVVQACMALIYTPLHSCSLVLSLVTYLVLALVSLLLLFSHYHFPIVLLSLTCFLFLLFSSFTLSCSVAYTINVCHPSYIYPRHWLLHNITIALLILFISFFLTSFFSSYLLRYCIFL